MDNFSMVNPTSMTLTSHVEMYKCGLFWWKFQTLGIF